MKKRLLFLFATSFYIYSVSAQTKSIKKKSSEEKGVSVSAGVSIPVGDFSSTHLIGIGVDCSPTRHSFGKIKAKKTAFTYNGGLAYYFGKKETVSGYPYAYPGYFLIHTFGGVLYNPVKNGSVTLTAGPALGIYNGNTQFNIGSKLEVSYYISKKITIGPGIILMKESGADPLWAAAVKAILSL